MKKISLKSQRKMKQDAARGRWHNLVELRRVPEFAAWLANEDHGRLGQSPGRKRDPADAPRRHDNSRLVRRPPDDLQQACHGAVVHILML